MRKKEKGIGKIYKEIRRKGKREKRRKRGKKSKRRRKWTKRKMESILRGKRKGESRKEKMKRDEKK